MEPLLITGAGPTGLMMALCLTKLGVPCRIIDKLPQATDQSRALGIHARTLEIFDSLAIVDDVIEQGLAIHDIAMHADRKRLAHLDYSIVNSLYPFVIMLPQSQTEAILTNKLNRLGIEVERECELVDFKQTENGVEASIQQGDRGETITTPYLIACDGAHSRVRKVLNMPFEGKTVQEQWILADVTAQHEQAGMDKQLQIFQDKNGMLVIFPLGGNQCRLVSRRPTSMDGDAEVTLDEFTQVAKRIMPWKLSIEKTSWLSPFKISYRKVKDIRQDRVFLCGDAAHIHSPVGGQGMNTGLQDAFNLAWKLAACLHRNAPDSLLDTFTIERKHVAHEVLQETEMATKLATLANPVLRALRNFVMSSISKTQMFQEMWIAKMSEVGIQYPATMLSQEHIKSTKLNKKSAVGKRMPDALLYDFDGKPFHLHRELATMKFLIILSIQQLDDKNQLQQSIDSLMPKGKENYTLVIILSSKIKDKLVFEKPVKCYLDNQEQFSKQFGLTTNTTYLIRPDGYIAYRNSGLTSDVIKAYQYT